MAGLADPGEPARVALDHGLEGLPGGAAVAEGRPLGDRGEVLVQRLAGVLGELVLVLLGLGPHDPQQFDRGVVVEGDGPREAGGDTGVGGQEVLHLRRVAGDDHHDGVAVVLHQFHQGVDRLPPEVPARVLGGEGVRLVDEQDPAPGTFEGLLGADGRRADVLAHQVDAGHLDQVAALQHAQGGQDLAVEPGDGGLARTGGAGEDQVAARGGALSPASRRLRPTAIKSIRERTSRLTFSRPTSASSSARTSSEGRVSSAVDGAGEAAAPVAPVGVTGRPPSSPNDAAAGCRSPAGAGTPDDSGRVRRSPLWSPVQSSVTGPGSANS